MRGELDWIVMKALEKDRTRRYETASSFAADVQHYLNDEAVVACPPSRPYLFKKFIRRNKAVLSTVAMGIALLFAGILGTASQARWAIQERDRAIDAEQDAQENLERAIAAEQTARLEAARATGAERRATEEAAHAVQEAENANTQAAIAKAVNEFLSNDLLAQADPENNPDRDLKLRTVLDRAALQIEGRFVEQPLVEAAIRHTLGRTYDGLGEFEEAERHLRRSLEIRDRELGREHLTTLLSLNGLAGAISGQGRHVEAEAMDREVSDIREQLLGPEHEQTLDSKMNLAVTLSDQGRYAEAEEILRDTIEVQERTLGSQHLSTLRAKMSLAIAIKNQGQPVKAEQLYRDVLEIGEPVLGSEHPLMIRSTINLARSISSQGRHAEAEKLYRRTIEATTQVFGPEHPTTLLAMNNLAASVGNQGRHVEVEEILREVAEIRERVLGPEHPETLRTMTNLALSLSRQGRRAEAVEVYRNVIEVWERGVGSEEALTPTSRRNLRLCYSALSHALATAADPSEQDLQQAVQFAEAAIKLFPEPGDRTVADWGKLGQLQYRAGHIEVARESLERVIKKRGDEGPSLQGGPRWWYYAMTLSRLGETAKATEIFETMTSEMKNTPPKNLKLYDALQTEAARLMGIDNELTTNEQPAAR